MTLEFVRCMGENVVNGVRINEVRLYMHTCQLVRNARKSYGFSPI